MYTRNEEAITLIYKNINSLLYLRKGWYGCMRERERWGQKLLWLIPHCNAFIQCFEISCFFQRRLIQGRLLNPRAAAPDKRPKWPDVSTLLTDDFDCLWRQKRPSLYIFLTPTYYFIQCNSLCISADSCLPLDTAAHLVYEIHTNWLSEVNAQQFYVVWNINFKI